MRSATGALLAFIGVLVMVIGVTASPAAADSSHPNSASYWTDRGEHPGQCYKYDPPNSQTAHGSLNVDRTAVILNQFDPNWPGDHWELLVVKGGSSGGDGNGNAIYLHPEAGVEYFAPFNGGGQQAAVSHWIVCKGSTPGIPTTTTVVPEPTTTTTAAATTTTVPEPTTTTTTTTVPDIDTPCPAGTYEGLIQYFDPAASEIVIPPYPITYLNVFIGSEHVVLGDGSSMSGVVDIVAATGGSAEHVHFCKNVPTPTTTVPVTTTTVPVTTTTVPVTTTTVPVTTTTVPVTTTTVPVTTTTVPVTTTTVPATNTTVPVTTTTTTTVPVTTTTVPVTTTTVPVTTTTVPVTATTTTTVPCEFDPDLESGSPGCIPTITISGICFGIDGPVNEYFHRLTNGEDAAVAITWADGSATIPANGSVVISSADDIITVQADGKNAATTPAAVVEACEQTIIVPPSITVQIAPPSTAVKVSAAPTTAVDVSATPTTVAATLPKTGSDATSSLLVMGALLVILGGMMLITTRRTETA